jgi:hypothetical protein
MNGVFSMRKRSSGLRTISLMTLLWAAAGSFGGCTHTLFGTTDNYTETRLERYWGGDSARASREASERGDSMGFSPTGGTGGGYQ